VKNSNMGIVFVDMLMRCKIECLLSVYVDLLVTIMNHLKGNLARMVLLFLMKSNGMFFLW
jgi:hypothetical protein